MVLINMEFYFYFQIVVEYPSGPRPRILQGEHEIIGRALARGCGIGRAITSCPTVAHEVFSIQASDVRKELDVLSSAKDKTILRCKDEASLKSFSWQKLHDELEEKAPKFLAVMKIVCENHDVKMKKELPAILSAASTIVAVHNPEMSALEYIKSLILLKGGANKSTFTRLNAVKTCMSYTMTIQKANEIASNADAQMEIWQTNVWNDRQREQQLLGGIEELKGNSDVASVLGVSRIENELKCLRRYMHPGYYIVGDNADMRTHARHHRLGHTDTDAHMFQLSAYRNRVSANHLDPNKPIGDLKTASFSTVMPSREDHDEMLQRLSYHVADTWRRHLKAFEKCEVPHTSHQHMAQTMCKTQRINLGVLNKCESKADDMMDICEATHKWVPGHQESMDPDVPVQPTRTAFDGDYLTFERTKATQTLKRNARTPSKQLKGLIPRTAEFHNQAELMKAMWHHLYKKTTAADIGTLYNVKCLLKSPVEEDPFSNYYDSADLLDRYTIAYLITGGMAFGGMPACDAPISSNGPDGEVTDDYLRDCAQQFVEQYVSFKCFETDVDAPRGLVLKCQYCDKTFKTRVSALVAHEINVHGHPDVETVPEQEQDYVYNYTCISLALCLLRWEHNDAIRYGDGERIIFVDRFLTLLYKTSKCPKYAYAMLETQCQVKILLSPHDAYLQTWNRTVNHQGQEDTNFPNDQDMEHQNRVFKSEAKTYRGKFTEQTLKRVSQSAQSTDAICRNFDNVTRVFRPSGKHPAPDWSEDIAKLVKSMKPMDLFTNNQAEREPRADLHTPHADIFEGLQMSAIKAWLKSSFSKFSRKHYYKY